MLNEYDRSRYDGRSNMGFGEESQEKLKKSKVVDAGAGGLGSPSSLYLAPAGIGTIRIIHCDKVELSNLNLQILHRDKDNGEYKAVSGGNKLRN
jgi:adenylyltransferase/sulfurtransferase